MHKKSVLRSERLLNGRYAYSIFHAEMPFLVWGKKKFGTGANEIGTKWCSMFVGCERMQRKIYALDKNQALARCDSRVALN